MNLIKYAARIFLRLAFCVLKKKRSFFYVIVLASIIAGRCLYFPVRESMVNASWLLLRDVSEECMQR